MAFPSDGTTWFRKAGQQIHPQPAVQRQRNPRFGQLGGSTRDEQKGNVEPVTAAPEASASPPVDLDVAADQAIAACGGDAREAVKALIAALDFLEAQFEEMRTKVSTG
jgi:hypothetical protein